MNWQLDIIEKLCHQTVKCETDFISAQPCNPVVPLANMHNPAEDQLKNIF